MRASELPVPRPVLWPLRPLETATVNVGRLTDGRRRITIEHAELSGVSPPMLAWWFGHIVGDMDYAGRQWPRYLVWHPLDHISYTVVKHASDGRMGPGAKLHVREAFQRNPDNLLDVQLDVERIDEGAAVISHQVMGLTVLRLVNRFEPQPTGTRYTSEMTIGSHHWSGRLGFNWLMRSRILPDRKALSWARHHVEEVGNLEHFLPDLYAMQDGRALQQARG